MSTLQLDSLQAYRRWLRSTTWRRTRQGFGTGDQAGPLIQ
jgi:hypothetical protein